MLEQSAKLRIVAQVDSATRFLVDLDKRDMDCLKLPAALRRRIHFAGKQLHYLSIDISSVDTATGRQMTFSDMPWDLRKKT